MSDNSVLQRVRDWWRTKIIDMTPGRIRLRGYPIETLIGRTTYAEMVWLMIRGELPSPEQAKLLEAALVASVDHGPQSPAIAIARMAITSGNDINHAMASAINVLGDTHGGAGQQCMALMNDIKARMDAGADLKSATHDGLNAYRKDNGKHIPGFGHRFHPVDPRAEPLLNLVDRAIAQRIVDGRFAAIGRAIETDLATGRAKPIPMNIDGATAVIFAELGFAPELGRGLFVLSRSVGILAHAWEQTQANERIKGPVPPEFLYTYDGPAPRDPDKPDRNAAPA